MRDERGHELAEHPDGIMQLRRWNTPNDWSPGWTASALLPDGLGGQESVWEAHLGNAPHLAAAFATALVDPAPVARAEFDVPHSGLVTQKPGGRQAEDLAAEHAARLARARATAVRNRRPPSPPSPSPARPRRHQLPPGTGADTGTQTGPSRSRPLCPSPTGSSPPSPTTTRTSSARPSPRATSPTPETPATSPTRCGPADGVWTPTRSTRRSV